MKLVSIHKQTMFLLFFLIGFQIVEAQVWTIQQCIDTAEVRNRNLQIGRNNLAISEQKEKEAIANLIPKATLSADYRYYFNLPYQLMPLSAFGGPSEEYKAIQFGVPNVINANVQLSMPLYNPQIYGAIQTTKIGLELAALQYQKTEEQIYFEISNLYYNAQILHYQIAFLDTNILNAERLLKITQLLNEHLLLKGTDVSKIKLQLSQLTTQKEIMSSKYEQVLMAMKFAMGISVNQEIQIEANIQYQNTNEYTPSSILDIRIIKTQNRLLSSEISTLSKSRYIPTLNLSGNYGVTGFGNSSMSNSFLDFYPVGFAGIQLSYPLFNGTVTQRKMKQKRYELQNSELQLESNIEQNNIQVENAKLQRGLAKKSVETTTEQIELAKTIHELTMLQQKEGMANLTDVLLANNVLREAQQSYLSAVVDYLKADLELRKLTGNISTTK